MADTNEKFNVGGVALSLPFRIRGLGHFGLNLNSIDRGIEFYSKLLGFRMVDEIDLRRIPVVCLLGLRSKGHVG